MTIVFFAKLLMARFRQKPFTKTTFRVILDLGPASKDMLLILPKQHYSDICELDEDNSGQGPSTGGKDRNGDEEIFELRRVQRVVRITGWKQDRLYFIFMCTLFLVMRKGLLWFRGYRER